MSEETSSIIEKIGDAPMWVWGAIGAIAFGYRTLRRDSKPHDVSLMNASVDACIGYAICASIPVITPVIVLGVGLEDWHRSKRHD